MDCRFKKKHSYVKLIDYVTFGNLWESQHRIVIVFIINGKFSECVFNAVYEFLWANLKANMIWSKWLSQEKLRSVRKMI